MSGLIKKVKSSVDELIVFGDRVLVAVSGGSDSMALLYLLEHFSKILGFKLFVAHLNHLTRGKESDEDARFVAEEADKLSLPFFMGRIDVAREKSHFKFSFQESARILRYRFLGETLLSIKGTKIALGHTADDQVETILMNLLRGSGLKGLAGIPETRGNVIRPILRCTRFELEEFLKDRNQPFRTDSSNREKKYLRNKIRHDVVPLLKTFNSNLLASLLDLADIVRAEDDWMSEEVRVLFSQLVSSFDGQSGLKIKISEFQKQSQALKRRLVREVCYRLKGNLREITVLHVRQVLGLFNKVRVGSWITLPGNIRVSCDYETICFSLGGKLKESLGSPYAAKEGINLKVPGSTRLEEMKVQFHASIVEPSMALTKRIDGKQAFFDFEKTGEFIQARYFRTGDHFVPLGMEGHKKLKSYFIDQKIPRDKRCFIPILTNYEDEIIWIYGERISDRFRITENTKKVLHIEGKGL